MPLRRYLPLAASLHRKPDSFHANNCLERVRASCHQLLDTIHQYDEPIPEHQTLRNFESVLATLEATHSMYRNHISSKQVLLEHGVFIEDEAELRREALSRTLPPLSVLAFELRGICASLAQPETFSMPTLRAVQTTADALDSGVTIIDSILRANRYFPRFFRLCNTELFAVKLGSALADIQVFITQYTEMIEDLPRALLLTPIAADASARVSSLVLEASQHLNLAMMLLRKFSLLAQPEPRQLAIGQGFLVHRMKRIADVVSRWNTEFHVSRLNALEARLGDFQLLKSEITDMLETFTELSGISDRVIVAQLLSDYIAFSAKLCDVPGGGSCSICLEQYGRGDLICEPICHHKFHARCMVSWTRTASRCPLCRASLI